MERCLLSELRSRQAEFQKNYVVWKVSPCNCICAKIDRFQKNYVVWKDMFFPDEILVKGGVSEELCSMERRSVSKVYKSASTFQKNYVVWKVERTL